MELQKAYGEVAERLGRIDFPALWEGFHPFKFALYNGDRCYFDGRWVERTAEFAANTAIMYQGELAAIWDLSREPGDLDRLTASVVHEMFHAFQQEQGESRWADELGALFDYRYRPENIAMRLEEARAMAAILEGGETGAFPELLALRKRRADRFPREYDYEARVEQIEGTAQYVETAALTALDPAKGAARRRRTLETIRDPEAYTPARVISYHTGAAFLECVRRCSDLPTAGFGPAPLAVEILSDVEPSRRGCPVPPEAERVVEDYARETGEIVRGALDKGKTVLRGTYRLGSLNVWDARWDGRYAVSNGFLSYWEGDERRLLEGDFVAELGRDRVIRTVYEQ